MKTCHKKEVATFVFTTLNSPFNSFRMYMTMNAASYSKTYKCRRLISPHLQHLIQCDSTKMPKFCILLLQVLIYFRGIETLHGIKHWAMVVVSNDRGYICYLSGEKKVQVLLGYFELHDRSILRDSLYLRNVSAFGVWKSSWSTRSYTLSLSRSSSLSIRWAS